MITMKEAIAKTVKGTDLTIQEAKEAMQLMLSGEATQAQMASYLTALRIKGETLDEIVGSASVMKEVALHVNTKRTNDYLDMVGTGGDGTNTFNISTTSVFVAAAAGLVICKHGNRAMSSRSGSVDVLEKLGLNVMLDNDAVSKCVDETGIGFMFAQVFIKAMKYVGPVRREIGTRTIFNILGPLSNPSNAKKQVIGVFDKNIVEAYANAMKMMGVERGMAFSGDNGMDELSTVGDTYISEIKDGEIINYVINPKDFGLRQADPSELKGGDGDENAEITTKILKGEDKGAKRDIVCLNAGAALYIGGIVSSIADGIKLAQETIDSGKAYAKLEEAVRFTNSFN